MKKYSIHMPFTGSAYMEVEAETEEKARELFWNTAELFVDAKKSNVVTELEFTEYVTEGNVTYALLNEFDIEELSD